MSKLASIGIELINTQHRKTALAMLKREANTFRSAENLCNLAVAMTHAGEYEQAEYVLDAVLHAEPANVQALHAAAVLAMVTAQPNFGVTLLDDCIKLHPDNGDFKFTRALALIQGGRWLDGLREYDIRRSWNPERVYPGLPFWDGSHGKSVFVWAEQGLGDTIQFARYIPWLASISAGVVFAVPACLHELFEPLTKHCTLIKLEDTVEGMDCGTALISLARYYAEAKDAEGCDTDAFMNVPPVAVKKFLPYQEYPGKLKVGLCWAVNPGSYHHRERSVPFEDLLALTANDEADFFSLQVGDAAGDIARCRAQRLVTDMSYCTEGSWETTAGVISMLDLVVTTDTSVAHLAASMGKPTVMFLARRDWWRWGNSGDKTPWYPSMTIVRADKPYSWTNEIRQVTDIIAQAVNDRKAKVAA